MSMFIDTDGGQNQVTLSIEHLFAAQQAQMSLPQYVNRTFPNADPTKGSAWRQLTASLGYVDPGARNQYGLRAPTVHQLLNGEVGGFQAAQGSGSTPNSTIFGGSESRLVFTSVIIEMAEARLYKDLTEDPAIFNGMIALDMSLASPNFEQPIIDYETLGGAQGANRARPQRISQWSEPTAMVRFGTSGKVRKIPTYSIGMEFSMEALKSTTLDLMGLTLARSMMVEEYARVNEQLADLWGGDTDINIGAISGVTTTSLDASASGGAVTYKSWIKWLRRNKTRKISHVICDIDAWLKVVQMTGRPNVAAYNPTIEAPVPQPLISNPFFGENVTFYIVDAAVDGGPVPANTLWGLDSRQGIVRVRNTDADYKATEQFTMRKTEAVRIDTGMIAYRQWDEAFDVLTIA
jgi:hypothetical protein